MMHTGRSTLWNRQNGNSLSFVWVCRGTADELRGKIASLTIWRVCPDSVKLLSCANSLAKLNLFIQFLIDFWLITLKPTNNSHARVIKIVIALVISISLGISQLP